MNRCLFRVLAVFSILVFVSQGAWANLSQPTRRERMQSEITRPMPSSSPADYAGIKENFINKDYSAVDRMAETYLSSARSRSDADDVLYLQAMSLMKLNRLPGARDKLKTLERSAASAEVKASAAAAVGDSFDQQGDRSSAWSAYQDALKKYPDSEQTAYLLGRLVQLGHDNGQMQEADGYRDRLLREYPGTQEAQDVRAHFPPSAARQTVEEPLPAASPVSEIPGSSGKWHCVQVGSFSKEANANALAGKLKAQGYDAYIVRRDWGTMFRVRVGKLKTRGEAAVLESRLAKDGYPTKIFP